MIQSEIVNSSNGLNSKCGDGVKRERSTKTKQNTWKSIMYNIPTNIRNGANETMCRLITFGCSIAVFILFFILFFFHFVLLPFGIN